MSKLVKVSEELVEDLNLARFCKGVFDPIYPYGNWRLIDRRRLKRELKRLPALVARAGVRFEAEMARHKNFKPAIILDAFQDWPLSDEQKKSVVAWYQQFQSERAMRALYDQVPLADMSRPPPRL